MSNVKDFLGSMLAGPLHRVFTKTGTYTPFRDEWVLVVLVGGGGSGGAAKVTSNQHVALAQGGTAGGAVYKLLRLSQGVTYTITIGAGGARVTLSGATSSGTDGTDGSDTTFAGSDITTITAAGGSGGQSQIVNPSAVTLYTLDVQRPSAGSEGDYHYKGGSGGKIDYTSANAGNQPAVASGGGGVNIFGLDAFACDGGDLEINNSGITWGDVFSSGGGGCGGRGGDITQVTSAGDDRATGGGGTNGDGSDLDNETSGSLLTSDGGDAATYTDDAAAPHSRTGAGGDGGGADGGDGAGGGGVTVTNNPGDAAGLFGGGGGAAGANSAAAFNCYAGDAGLGGGGGGAAFGYSTDANARCYSGDGGNGIVFLYSLGFFAP